MGLKQVCAAGIMLAALCACSKAGDSENGGQHSWTVRGEMRVAIQQDVKSLNPLLNSNTTDGFIAYLMFEPLLSADDRGNPVPMLAAAVPSTANGGISADGLTITYRLRDDAKWTDGVAVTSADVKWSWQAILNPNDNVISRHGYDLVRAIDTPDARTVVVHLKRRFAPFVNTFFAESDQPYDVVPAHVLAHYPNVNQVPFDARPAVSDGPFRFVSWRRGDRIVLDANPSFFEGPPALRRVVIEFVPNEDSAINLLAPHAVDYIFQPSIQTYPALRALPDARIVWVNVNGYDGIE